MNALKSLPEYQTKDGEVLIPYEDTAGESNWPRFGNRESAYIKPIQEQNTQERIDNYIEKIAELSNFRLEKIFLIINMNPFRRIPLRFCKNKNIIVADGSLAYHERQINNNTISLPALPITKASQSSLLANKRNIKASFQGAMSHSCRESMKRINNNNDIIIKAKDRSNYVGRVDALKGIYDKEYSNLLDNSIFGIVAKGDALFSYRLLETISRGAIPLVVSDGWVLPFDRTIDWNKCSLRFHQEAIDSIPYVVNNLEEDVILRMQENSIKNYNNFFKDIRSIMQTMINEALILKKFIQ